MKTKLSLWWAFFLLFVFAQYGFSQSISEKFEGVKVSFDITTADTINLNDDHQFLIRRAHAERTNMTDLGYQSIHLEFKTKKSLNMWVGLGRGILVK